MIYTLVEFIRFFDICGKRGTGMDVNDVTSRLNEQMTTELYKQLGTVSKKTITSTLLDNLSR